MKCPAYVEWAVYQSASARRSALGPFSIRPFDDSARTVSIDSFDVVVVAADIAAVMRHAGAEPTGLLRRSLLLLSSSRPDPAPPDYNSWGDRMGHAAAGIPSGYVSVLVASINAQGQTLMDRRQPSERKGHAPLFQSEDTARIPPSIGPTRSMIVGRTACVIATDDTPL